MGGFAGGSKAFGVEKQIATNSTEFISVPNSRLIILINGGLFTMICFE